MVIEGKTASKMGYDLKGNEYFPCSEILNVPERVIIPPYLSYSSSTSTREEGEHKRAYIFVLCIAF